jgi:hypothetical protein
MSPAAHACRSSLFANGITHLQFLNSQLGALYELRRDIGIGKLGAASGKGRQQVAHYGLQKPRKKDLLFLSALMRPTSRWRISETRRRACSSTSPPRNNCRRFWPICLTTVARLCFFGRACEAVSCSCILSVHPSQSQSERKFSGDGKTMSGEHDAKREAQLPLVAVWWNICPLLPPRP